MSKNSKRVLTVLITIGALVFYVGGYLIKDAREVARQNPPNPVIVQQVDTFLTGYERSMGTIESEDEAVKLVKAGKILCVYLDNDPDLKGAFLYGTDKLDLSSDQAVAVIDNGIHAFCMKHKPLQMAGE